MSGRFALFWPFGPSHPRIAVLPANTIAIRGRTGPWGHRCRGEDMEKHQTFCDRIRPAVAIAAALLLPALRAHAQVQVPNCEIRAAEGGKLDNASTSEADLNAFQDG